MVLPVRRSERQLAVVEVFEIVFAVTSFGVGLARVPAAVIVDRAGAVTVLYGVGEVAEEVAQMRDGFDGEVVGQWRGVVGVDVDGDGGARDGARRGRAACVRRRRFGPWRARRRTARSGRCG